MFDFPNSPTVGQTVTSPGGTYRWDGAKWVSVGSSSGGPPGTVTNVTAGAGLTGGTITTTGTIALSAPVTVANGGTGASTAGAALTALGAAPLASPAFTGTPSMPTGTTAVTQAVGTNTTALATTQFVQAAAAPAFNDTGRNLLHNGQFNIAQRGTGPFTTPNGILTLDRWQLGVASDTVSITRVAITDAQRSAIGDEAAVFALQNVFTGNAAAGAQNYLNQNIESVRRLAGKTITLSFWAAAASGTPKLGVNYWQVFGTGGSPSATVYPVNATGQSVTLSATFTRYSLTTTLPSAAGKTLGTNGDDQTGVVFFFSSGTTGNAAAGNIGVQSGTIQLWGVQLEIGSVATPLAYRDPQQEIALCQRFYQVGTSGIFGANPGAGVGFANILQLPVTPRAAPTFATSGVTYTNASAVVCANFGVVGCYQVGATATASGSASVYFNFTASADL